MAVPPVGSSRVNASSSSSLSPLASASVVAMATTTDTTATTTITTTNNTAMKDGGGIDAGATNSMMIDAEDGDRRGGGDSERGDGATADSHPERQQSPIASSAAAVASSAEAADAATAIAIASEEDEAFRALNAEKVAIDAEKSKNYETTFDMFSATPTEWELNPNNKNGKAAGGVPKAAASNKLPEALLLEESNDAHLQSNWDDAEGYYRARIGEVIIDRYRTLGIVGKGVFSTVIKCADLLKPIHLEDTTLGSSSSQSSHPPGSRQALQIGSVVNDFKFESVAIKFIRSNEVMR